MGKSREATASRERTATRDSRLPRWGSFAIRSEILLTVMATACVWKVSERVSG